MVLVSVLIPVNFFRLDCVPLMERLGPENLVALLKSLFDLLTGGDEQQITSKELQGLNNTA